MTRKKTFILISTATMFVILLLMGSPALAECPDDRVGVTIITPAGRVISICVPENVVDNIGGPGDVVIAATCPCYTADDVATAVEQDPEHKGYMEVDIDNNGDEIVDYVGIEANGLYYGRNRIPAQVPIPSPPSKLYDTNGGACDDIMIPSGNCKYEDDFDVCYIENGWCYLLEDYEQIRACDAILSNALQWVECTTP